MKLKILFFPIALFVAFMMTIFFTKPEWDVYSAENAELGELNNELDELTRGHSLIKSATTKFESLGSNQTSLILNAIPTKEDDDNFLAEIHKSAERSGVFIVATKVNSEGTDNHTNKKTSSKSGSMDTKPDLQTSTAEISVLGSYLEIAKFVKELDVHNRLTLPKNLSITAQDSETTVVEGEEVVADSGSLVKCEITFDFFEKAKNDKLQIASLIRAEDPVIKSLLSGQFKTAVIEKYQDNITKEVFRPVSSEKAGKEDIFSK